MTKLTKNQERILRNITVIETFSPSAYARDCTRTIASLLKRRLVKRAANRNGIACVRTTAMGRRYINETVWK